MQGKVAAVACELKGPILISHTLAKAGESTIWIHNSHSPHLHSPPIQGVWLWRGEQDNSSWHKSVFQQVLPILFIVCNPRKGLESRGSAAARSLMRVNPPPLLPERTISGTPCHDLGNSCKTPGSDVLLWCEISAVFAKQWLWMTNQPCIYFKKAWKQPCYFWKHGHLFRASWQGRSTVEGNLKNRESVVPPTALLRILVHDVKSKPTQRQEVPPWSKPKLKQSPRPDNHPYHQIPHPKVQGCCHR